MIVPITERDEVVGLLSSTLGLRSQADARSMHLDPSASLGHHHLDELFVVDLPVAIDICLTDHLIDLLISELLAKVGHDVAQLCRTDEAIAIAIKYLEGFDQLFLGVICLMY